MNCAGVGEGEVPRDGYYSKEIISFYLREKTAVKNEMKI